MSRVIGIIFAVFLVFVIVIQSVIIVFLLVSRSGGMPFLSDSTIAVIGIDDVIIDSKVFLDRIDRYADDEDVKAIVLRMETPGGAVAASQEIAAKVKRIRADGKIVVTSVANLGASGGYYVATYSDAIVVNPGSLVGSIGVILQHFEMKELADRLGLGFESIVSGKMKDAGSITRPLGIEERAYFQEMIDNAYGQFHDAVLATRWKALAAAAGVEESDTDAIKAQLAGVADGRVLTGEQAFDAGLADHLGDLEDAIDVAADLAGIVGEPNVIIHNPDDPWKEFGKIFGLANLFPAAHGPAILPSGLWYIYR